MTGQELRARRERLGWTKAKLALELGVTAHTVARLEEASEVPEKYVNALMGALVRLGLG